MMTPRVVDISHHNTVNDLQATAAAGIWGVIHKSSQGSGYRDPDYATRRRLAKAAGLLWGAYHFNDGSDVARQVDWFIACARPDESTLMVLDFEDNAKSNMTVQQAVRFLRLLEQKTGRKGAIYSGNRLKETIGQLSATDRAYICSHRLWLCQYGPRAVLPKGFKSYWLWQYTGDGVGLPPHNVPGITAGNRGLDCNVFDGDRTKLETEWVPGGRLVTSNIGSSHSSEAERDQDDVDEDADDGDADAPPNVVPIEDPEAIGDRVLFNVQKRLKARRYSPGKLDGLWGGGTSGALSGFRNDRGMTFTMPLTLDEFHGIADEVRAELTRAEAERWFRPVTEERANADPKLVQELAPEVAPVKRNFWVTLWGSIAAFFSGLVDAISGYISDAWKFFTDHKDVIDDHPGIMTTAWSHISAVPSAVWLLLGAAGLAFIAFNSWSAIKTSTQAIKTGERQ